MVLVSVADVLRGEGFQFVLKPVRWAGRKPERRYKAFGYGRRKPITAISPTKAQRIVRGLITILARKYKTLSGDEKKKLFEETGLPGASGYVYKHWPEDKKGKGAFKAYSEKGRYVRRKPGRGGAYVKEAEAAVRITV